jgi:Flp pilus assembly protein TadB
MPAIAATDLARMRDALLFDSPERARKLSRFWALLLLAAVIATAGVVTDSTATVIGAMIVAPLMTRFSAWSSRRLRRIPGIWGSPSCSSQREHVRWSRSGGCWAS